MDNPAIVLLWLIGVGLGGAVALYVFRRPRRAEEPEMAELSPERRFGGSLGSVGQSVRRALGSGVGDDTWRDLTEVLLGSDVGVETTTKVVQAVREGRPGSEGEARRLLGEALRGEMHSGDRFLSMTGSPAVWLVIGVNGTGKTTSIAKLGRWLMSQGRSVILAAADTFRAGAGNQLKVWGDRLATRVVVGAEGADPASVAFDSVVAASASGVDVVIVDTAGRLHGKTNLMEELAKIHRVVGGEDGVDEVLLVLDASAGQNGLAQVREFARAVPVTGIILAKLDGTAKGGIVLAVERILGVPVKFVGIGERIDDLVPFDPDGFVDALLGET